MDSHVAGADATTTVYLQGPEEDTAVRKTDIVCAGSLIRRHIVYQRNGISTSRIIKKIVDNTAGKLKKREGINSL